MSEIPRIIDANAEAVAGAGEMPEFNPACRCSPVSDLKDVSLMQIKNNNRAASAEANKLGESADNEQFPKPFQDVADKICANRQAVAEVTWTCPGATRNWCGRLVCAQSKEQQQEMRSWFQQVQKS